MLTKAGQLPTHDEMPIGGSTFRRGIKLYLDLESQQTRPGVYLGSEARSNKSEPYCHTFLQPEIQHHGPRTEDVPAGNRQKNRQGPFEVQRQQERRRHGKAEPAQVSIVTRVPTRLTTTLLADLSRLCLIHANVCSTTELSVVNMPIPNHRNRLVKEAAIDSKQAGERNISAKSIRKATPVRSHPGLH